MEYKSYERSWRELEQNMVSVDGVNSIQVWSYLDLIAVRYTLSGWWSWESGWGPASELGLWRVAVKNSRSHYSQVLRVCMQLFPGALSPSKFNLSVFRRTPEYRSGTLMPVRTTFAQKLASTLMQSGQNHPILSGYPDDYPDKNPAPRPLMVPPCLRGEAVRVDIWVSNAPVYLCE